VPCKLWLFSKAKLFFSPDAHCIKGVTDMCVWIGVDALDIVGEEFGLEKQASLLFFGATSVGKSGSLEVCLVKRAELVLHKEAS
jgi:hypothetical protein